ncbi:MAG: hypothetical protein NT046_04985 [Arenimonas sp.]|nr:hypothetical protein [Arenimonas sp.]
MNSTRRTVLSLLLAALLLAGAGLLLIRKPPSPEAVRETAPATQAVDQADAVTDGASPTDSPPTPLPPANAPIAAIAATLQQRADAGDSRAACRLAAELIRCRQDAAYLAAVADPQSPMSDRLARAGKLDEAISLDERMLAKSEQQQQCRALPKGLLDRAGDYLTQAARAGEPEAMILYVEGQHFPPVGMGRLADAGFEAWRRETPAMAQALLRRGEPEAVFILALAYADDEDWFGGLVPDDPVLSEAYSQLLRRLSGRVDPTRPGALDADDLLRAHELAEDWHARHFDNRRIDRSELTRRLTLMTHRRPESSPAPCES